MGTLTLDNFTSGNIGRYDISYYYLNEHKDEYNILMGTNSNGSKCGMLMLKNPITFQGTADTTLQPSTIWAQNSSKYYDGYNIEIHNTEVSEYKYKPIIYPCFSFNQLIANNRMTNVQLSDILGLPETTTYAAPDSTGINFLQPEKYALRSDISWAYNIGLSRQSLGISDELIGYTDSLKDMFSDLRIKTQYSSDLPSGWIDATELGNPSNLWLKYNTLSGTTTKVSMEVKPLVMYQYPGRTVSAVLLQPFIMYGAIGVDTFTSYIYILGVESI